jgi:peptidoglycan/xylan/chitin deacetylase (PgdA/CDA1 family)
MPARTFTSSSPGVASVLAPLRGPLRNRSGRAVVLCYHSVASGGPDWTSIEPDTFERQLAVLRRSAHRSVSQDGLADLAAGRRPEQRAALLTFDDGYRDTYTEALPRLRAYGFRGLIFILPPYVDDAGAFDWPEVEERRRAHPEVMRSLEWGQVEELADAGCEFGSHGCRHAHLTELCDADLREELWESRRAIKEHLGRCDALAYPFGEWSGRVARAAAEAGYSWAFSLPLRAQSTTTPMSIPRVVVDYRDDGLRFRLKVNPLGRRVFLSELKVRIRALARPGRSEQVQRFDAHSGERVFS